mmetsp:Transcript_35964/g.58149  ORF Transcript_35964/g.58149 Transcript_35964/m.58149 type:complete len:104 (-) Transcript_35964:727-1038(-)
MLFGSCERDFFSNYLKAAALVQESTEGGKETRMNAAGASDCWGLGTQRWGVWNGSYVAPMNKREYWNRDADRIYFTTTAGQGRVWVWRLESKAFLAIADWGWG